MGDGDDRAVAGAGEVVTDFGDEHLEVVEGGEGVVELVRRVHQGDVGPGDLSTADRQRCVDHLTLEGFSNSEISGLLRVSERTVRRDREALRQASARPPSRTLGDELLGEYERLTHDSVQRLRRLARDPSTPAYARLWAEDAIARVYQRFVETARRLGYIENGSRRLPGAAVKDPIEIERERVITMKILRNLQAAANRSRGPTPTIPGQV